MADDAAAWRGRLIDERYLVEDLLGAGGMGVVLRARHQFTGARVALKVLRPELAADRELQRRFLAEARAGNAIAHPGIVEVIDAGRDATGELYLAMELLDGESLRAPIQRRALTAVDVRRIGRELADALGAAHARGFVHRDLKPENVFLVAPTATVKLLDFGIAKVLAPEVGGTVARTAAGVIMGTPAYMAPEQLADARGVDARADLWALGVMLYEMLAGQLPFGGRTYEELFVAVAAATPIPITRILAGAPPVLDAFFSRALARDPGQRFQTAADLATALEQLPLAVAPIAPIAARPPPVSVLASAYATPSPGIGSTDGTAPGLVSLPPHTQPPLVTAPVPPRSDRRRSALWILAAVLVAGGAVVIAHLATRGGSSGAAITHGSAAPPLDAGVAVAIAIATVPDAATLAPVDASMDPAVLPDPKADPKPDPKADPKPDPKHVTTIPHALHDPKHPAAPRLPAEVLPPSTAAACAAGCAYLGSCGVGFTTCKAGCLPRADVARCMTDAVAAHSCEQAAGCGFLINCGVYPSGHSSCKSVWKDQLLCRNNAACVCSHVRALDIGHAFALAQADGCAAGCGGGATCLITHCNSLVEHCLGQ